jgi:limonene-1,2-epoxide hydrolase
MWVQLHPRQAEHLRGKPTGRGDDVGNHQIGRQLPQPRRVEHGHPRGALVDLGAGVAVIVKGTGFEAIQFDGVDAGRTGEIQYFHPGQQRRFIATGQELQTQRYGRKRMPRIGPGDHGHTHRPTVPQGALTTLAAMTEQLPDRSTTTDPALLVETFLYALRDKDFDAADATLDDDLVYQNVGLPTIRGRQRTMKMMRGLDRPNAGFDVKIHRIATEGSAVLTERTDVLTFGSFSAHFWVCGVFEVRDGRITLWRDYFDFYDFTKGIVRGLLALAIPSLRRSL